MLRDLAVCGVRMDPQDLIGWVRGGMVRALDLLRSLAQRRRRVLFRRGS